MCDAFSGSPELRLVPVAGPPGLSTGPPPASLDDGPAAVPLEEIFISQEWLNAINGGLTKVQTTPPKLLHLALCWAATPPPAPHAQSSTAELERQR